MRTIWPFKLNRKGEIFGRFLLSYFLILIIPIIVGAYAYNKTVNVVREDAAELNLAVLEQSEEALSRLLAEIKDIVALLSLDSEVLNLMLTTDESWSANAVYRFSMLQKNELNMLTTNQLISELFVYLQKSEAIIATDHIERRNTHPMRINDVPFGQWLEEVISAKQVNQYLRVENVNNGRTTGNYIAYVSSLPAGNQTQIDGAIIIFMNEQSFIKLFSRLLTEEGSFAKILNQNNEVIVSATADAGLLDPKDRQMFVTTVHSEKNGWTFMAGLPEDIVFAKADYIKRINWTIGLIASVVGCLIALVFAYRNTKPLSELLESIIEFGGGETNRKSNEMDLLKTTFQQIISSNNNLNVTMNQQLQVFQSACFERLLKSGFNHKQELREHLDQAQIKLYGDYILVAIIRMHSSAYMPEEELGLIAMKAQIKILLHNELNDGCYVHDLKLEKLAILLSFKESGDADHKLNLIVAELRRFQDTIQQEYNIMTSIGLGQVYHDEMDVWRSYNEAAQVLDYQDPDSSQLLVIYDPFNKSSSHYYYPLELELKLINTVKSGDSEALARMLEFIEIQNYEVRQLSLWRKKQLFLEMEGTLQKLMEQVPYIPEMIELQMDKMMSLDSEELEARFPLIKSNFMSMTEFIKQQKNTKSQSTFESMKTYISAHYMDNNLSLNMLASHHKQTESSVSIFFKEQMGITFSEYLEQLRLEEACSLLKESQLPIQEIAIRVGYSSDKSFRRAFKRAYGIQPTSYRKDQGASVDQ